MNSTVSRWVRSCEKRSTRRGPVILRDSHSWHRDALKGQEQELAAKIHTNKGEQGRAGECRLDISLRKANKTLDRGAKKQPRLAHGLNDGPDPYSPAGEPQLGVAVAI